MSELLPVKHLCQQLQAEQAAAEKRHREELEQSKQAAGGLRAELPWAPASLGSCCLCAEGGRAGACGSAAAS